MSTTSTPAAVSPSTSASRRRPPLGRLSRPTAIAPLHLVLGEVRRVRAAERVGRVGRQVAVDDAADVVLAKDPGGDGHG